ncbi:MAG TPA: MFS transporter [Gammaproteobacteria bacterium]|nr:MFS transporter [Gammaproteobacteria bacterium]
MSAILDHLDQLRIGRVHKRSAWAAGLGIFLDGYDLSIIAVALILLKPQWQLDAFDTGLLGASALAGALVGSLFGGPLADRFGRKAIYLLDIATFLIAALASGFAWSVASLTAMRFILGIGVGADYPLSATYLVEFLPRAQRGRISIWVFALWMGGAAVSSAVGLALLPFGEHAWRIMLASGALPAFAVLWLRKNLPESPRWYLRRGQPEEAVRVLGELDPTLSEATRHALLAAEAPHATRKRTPWLTLFRPNYIRRTVFITVPWFLVDVMSYSFGIYAPMLLMQLGLHGKVQSVIGNTVLDIVSLIGTALLAATVDRSGRLKAQVRGFIGGTIGLGLVGVFALRGEPPLAILILGLVGWQIANSYGPGNTCLLFPVELYPTDLRASAHGVATAFSRIGALFAVFCLPAIQAWIGNAGLMLLFTGVALLGAVLSAWLGEETMLKPLQQDAMPDNPPFVDRLTLEHESHD